MLLEIVRAEAAREKLAAMRRRASQADAEITEAARAVLEDIRENGIDAVQKYSMQFDKAPAREITAEELQAAYDACDASLRESLERAAENIRAYHMQRVPESWSWEKSEGRILGQQVRGLDRVGLYVPGGTAAYPSSVLMTAIPARCAGVREIVMVTPPTRHLSVAVLAAAKIAGIDRVFAVGGVQAIGALTYGAGFIPRVDKLVGPGNASVAAAKRLVFGSVDIDMVAGPSEVLVLADESADPRFVAADLLSQAEHDERAGIILVTDSMKLAEDVAFELERQSVRLERRQIIVKSVTDFGAAIVCDNMEAAVEMANEIAPEHLEIVTENPRALLPGIRNAGAVFLGEWSPEPLGDYMAGPSHVLPTSGSARFFSPLGVDSFIKRMSVIEYGRDTLLEDAQDILRIARTEELTAHANAVEQRLIREGIEA